MIGSDQDCDGHGPIIAVGDVADVDPVELDGAGPEGPLEQIDRLGVAVGVGEMVVTLKRRRQRPIRPRWRMMRATRLRLAYMPSRRRARWTLGQP